MSSKSLQGFRFQLEKPNSKNLSSILFVLHHEGNRFKYGTGQMIFPELWDKATQRPTTDTKIIKPFEKDHSTIKTDLQNINSRLENIITVSKTYLSKREEQKERVNFDDLKLKLKSEFTIEPGRNSARKKSKTEPETRYKITDLINQYILGMKAGTKKTAKKQNYDTETIKAYTSFQKMFDELETFHQTTYKVTDISKDFENDLHIFFDDEKEYTPNTKGKMIKMLKVIIHDFINDELETIYRKGKKGEDTELSITDITYIERQLDKIIKPTSKPVHIALFENELTTIFELELKNKPHLDRARDIFLTGCYTGLRFSDYSRISPEHVKNGFLEIIMYKGKEKVFIPIRKELVSILQKWSFKIPDMTSQELGRYIKEIGEMAGITGTIEIIESKRNQTVITTKPKYRMITTHTARRSFATNMFYSGMSPVDIMKITGHKKLDTFQKYIVYDPARERERLSMKGNVQFMKVV